MVATRWTSRSVSRWAKPEVTVTTRSASRWTQVTTASIRRPAGPAFTPASRASSGQASRMSTTSGTPRIRAASQPAQITGSAGTVATTTSAPEAVSARGTMSAAATVSEANRPIRVLRSSTRGTRSSLSPEGPCAVMKPKKLCRSPWPREPSWSREPSSGVCRGSAPGATTSTCQSSSTRAAASRCHRLCGGVLSGQYEWVSSCTRLTAGAPQWAGQPHPRPPRCPQGRPQSCPRKDPRHRGFPCRRGTRRDSRGAAIGSAAPGSPRP